MKTVPTQALQIWLRRHDAELGWERAGPSISAGFVEPFDTWADMTHLIGAGELREAGRAAIAYFCSVLPDAIPATADAARVPERARREEVARNADAVPERATSHAPLAAAAARGGAFRWDYWLIRRHRRDAGGRGPRRGSQPVLDAPTSTRSDRYVLSLPGQQLDTGSRRSTTRYDNLTVAGDWTDCGFNEGCVEAAVMSGRLAAHALSGSPAARRDRRFRSPMTEETGGHREDASRGRD